MKALPHYARFECPDGTVTFSIHQTETLATGDGVPIYFECEDLNGYVKELIEKGVKFESLSADQN
ncbi:MAG: hypothetical protein ACJAUQ_000535 [Maribacter sp.]